jgi:hypothetical protein
MKLISVQSRGNRLARVYNHPQGYGYSYYGLTIDLDGQVFLDAGKDHMEQAEALKAAAEWLKGATA